MSETLITTTKSRVLVKIVMTIKFWIIQTLTEATGVTLQCYDKLEIVIIVCLLVVVIIIMEISVSYKRNQHSQVMGVPQKRGRRRVHRSRTVGERTRR